MNSPFKDKSFIFLLASVILVLALELLSWVKINVPMPYAPLVFAAFILGIGYEVIWKGLKALIKLRFSSINLLMLLAVTAAFYLGEYPEAAVVIVLYVLGERLEDIGIGQSKSALNSLLRKTPKSAMLKEGMRIVPVDEVPTGSLILVKPGELIPLDGTVVKGESTVDESTITGEPIPRDKHPGDSLFAGTLNKEGFIEMRTSCLAADTTFSRIVRLTFEARSNKSDTQKFIERFSQIYTPIVLGLAVLLLLVPVLFFNREFDYWLLQAISLLVIACPCALVISTPVAIYAAIGNASARGILIKGGKYLEIMACIRALALDKTRTITSGNPLVSDIIPFGDTTREELLACASGAEVFSDHPLARAIVEAARKEGHEPHPAEGYRHISGKGAIAKCLVCEDETIYVGKLAFIGEYTEITEEAEKVVQRLSEQGKTSVVVSFGKGIAGIIGLSDELKEDSARALQNLKSLGIESIMLTGDNQKAAEHVASQTGISLVYGNLLPEDKARHIDRLLHEYGVVAMAGDGINDAPALARSSVGIAMGSAGSDTAIETANIALMHDKLSEIPFLVRLGRSTLRRIRFNTFGAIAVKSLFIFLAFLGYSQLVFAIAADVGVTLIVILLSLNLKRFS